MRAKMSEDIYIVCGLCGVKISGPSQELATVTYRGHEKEVHNYMIGQEWYERFEKLLDPRHDSQLANDEKEYMLMSEIREAARKAAKLEGKQ
jgi:hypothetical protein